jgi:hypothetical protein
LGQVDNCSANGKVSRSLVARTKWEDGGVIWGAEFPARAFEPGRTRGYPWAFYVVEEI